MSKSDEPVVATREPVNTRLYVVESILFMLHKMTTLNFELQGQDCFHQLFYFVWLLVASSPRVLHVDIADYGVRDGTLSSSST